MTKAWFNVRRAAQVAAYFAKAEGGDINVLKLVKLIYLADRLAMEKYDYPLLFDRLVSMDHGPVDSLTFAYINGCQDDRSEWEKFITDRSNYSVGLANSALSEEDFDQLSEADLEVLAYTWVSFGNMTKYQIRDYTHAHCPEWEDPDGSSLGIPYERVFKFLGKPDSHLLAQRIMEKRRIDEAFAGST